MYKRNQIQCAQSSYDVPKNYSISNRTQRGIVIKTLESKAIDLTSTVQLTSHAAASLLLPLPEKTASIYWFK
jgi:hypothetical protein